MSEMTVEQAIELLKANKTILEHKPSKGKEFEMAISALEKEEMFSKLINKAFDAFIKLKEENEKMKDEIKGKDWRIKGLENVNIDCAECCNRLRNKNAELIEDIHKRNSEIDNQKKLIIDFEDDKKHTTNLIKSMSEEIKQLKEMNYILRDESETMANDYLKLSCMIENQISGVELLEWFSRQCAKDLKKVFGSKLISVFSKEYTPQEIVDKITEYERVRNTDKLVLK